MVIRALLFSSVFVFCAGIAFSQPTALTCVIGAVNPVVRAEGIAENLGDVVAVCSGGSPGSVITVNLAIFLNVGVTNRVSATGVTDVSLTVDSGSGPVPSAVPGLRQSNSSVSFNGVVLTVPASGGVTLRIGNLRGNASQIGAGGLQPIQAVLSISGGIPSGIVGNTNPLSVGLPVQGLLATLSTTGIRCTGSPLPAIVSFGNLIIGGTRFVSTRVTEGFPSAFEKKTATSDSGTRIVARYSGLPAGARLFVPDVLAGSDAVQPTAAGDLGGTPSAGAYAPGGSGSLLLARVTGTDANGAGGTVAYTPGAPGSGTVAFNSVSEITLTNGNGIAVYEVVDADFSIRESAQFPTFLGLAPIPDGSAPVATEQVSFGPISTVFTASTTDPVPRFITLSPPSDCGSLQDCNAAYFPALSVSASRPLQYTAFAGSALQTKTVQVNNKGGGVLSWTASVEKVTGGANWLTVNPAAGVNGGTVLVNVFPERMPAGVYTATLLIDAGSQSGSQTLPISVTVTAFPVAPPPTPTPLPTPTPVVPTVSVQSLTSAARPDWASVAPGSLGTVKGSHLKGKDVTVTFDGIVAFILSGDDNSINVQLPASLASRTTSQLQVMVDGQKSAPLTVFISELAPAVFAGGVVNEDNLVNATSNAAAVGSALQIFSTGLAGLGPTQVIVKLHDRTLTPFYAGIAPGQVGVQQANIFIPADLPAMTTQLSVCGFGTANPVEPVCSEPVDVTLK